MFRVRPLLHDDAERVFQFEDVMAKAKKTNPEIKDAHPPPKLMEIRNRIYARMSRPVEERDPIVTAVYLGSIIGMASVEKICFGAGELEIAVHPDYWGRGVGTAMLDSAIGESRTRFNMLRLSVYASNMRAKRLYLKFGFRRIGPDLPIRLEKDGDAEEDMFLEL